MAALDNNLHERRVHIIGCPCEHCRLTATDLVRELTARRLWRTLDPVPNRLFGAAIDSEGEAV